MRLRRSNLSGPGIQRRRRGRGFSYHLDGGAVGAACRERIEALAIPPAWKQVWICPDERGHIQAVGTDAAGRRQYLYHGQWRARRDREKFARMTAMAQTLPRLRATVTGDLRGRGLTRRRVLAAAVRLLDRAALRIGGEAYAVDDPRVGEATFGLATVRREHARVRNGTVTLSFPAKGGVPAEVVVRDAELAPVVRALLRRADPHEELFAYWQGRRWVDVRSGDVNDYLREISGAGITAKDFRTWHGTVAATVALGACAETATKTARKRAVAQAMRQTAQILGNTPAVARASYVDPRIVDAFHAGALPGNRAEEGDQQVADAFADPKRWQRAEQTAMLALQP